MLTALLAIVLSGVASRSGIVDSVDLKKSTFILITKGKPLVLIWTEQTKARIDGGSGGIERIGKKDKATVIFDEDSLEIVSISVRTRAAEEKKDKEIEEEEGRKNQEMRRRIDAEFKKQRDEDDQKKALENQELKAIQVFDKFLGVSVAKTEEPFALSQGKRAVICLPMIAMDGDGDKIASLMFLSRNQEWRFLKNHSVYFLYDGKRMPTDLKTRHDGDYDRHREEVRERVSVYLTTPQFRKLSEAKVVEIRIGLEQFSLTPRQIQALADVYKESQNLKIHAPGDG